MVRAALVGLMRVGEVADALAVSEATVRRMIREGRLPVVRPRPHMVRVRSEDVAAYLETVRG